MALMKNLICCLCFKNTRHKGLYDSVEKCCFNFPLCMIPGHKKAWDHFVIKAQGNTGLAFIFILIFSLLLSHGLLSSTLPVTHMFGRVPCSISIVVKVQSLDLTFYINVRPGVKYMVVLDQVRFGEDLLDDIDYNVLTFDSLQNIDVLQCCTLLYNYFEFNVMLNRCLIGKYLAKKNLL